MNWFPVSSDSGVLAVLAGVCASFFWLERLNRWAWLSWLLKYFPPLVFIYLTPVVLANTGLLAGKSPVFDGIGRLVLPMMLVLLLLKVDVRRAVRVLGRGVAVMLFGTFGVMIGAPIGLMLVKDSLEPGAWKAFGTLAGSWIGGTGNMAAVSDMIEADGVQVGLAVLGDSTIYLLWLPLLLASKSWAAGFASLTGATDDHLKKVTAAVAAETKAPVAPTTFNLLALLAIALCAAWAAEALAPLLPTRAPILSARTWRVLLVTAFGIGLSMTPARRIPASHELGMALVYLFVARMGATADLSSAARQAPAFLLGALVMIAVHGACCLLGAKLLKVDVHTAAIASAANIGGAASASVVASHHREDLVPAAILMALIGYAIGNFAGWGAAWLCLQVS